MIAHRRSSHFAAIAAIILAGSGFAQTPDPPPPAAASPAVSAWPGTPAPRRSPAQVAAASTGILRPGSPGPVRAAGHVTAFAMKGAAAPARRRPHPAMEPGDQDDPSYGLYKDAYDLILRERWEEARRIFTTLSKKYPDSEYRDDAEYWMAYSWRETDRKKAMEAYSQFLKTYKQSKYFDDALADMDMLMAKSMAVAMPDLPPGAAVAPHAVIWPFGDSGHTVTAATPLPSIAPMMKYRRLEGLLRTTNPVWRFGRLSDGEEIDDATRLRLESLYAIGMTGEDEKGFTTLRRIAIDPKEKQVLRVAAIEGLSEYRNHDILPVFIEIAKNDTSEEMQLFAIDYIGSAAHDKGKAFDALMTLYKSLPSGKPGKRKMVFYSIAELGNEKAIDFLAGVARSNEEIELRREAVYYLGTIGGEKARAVLYDIVNGK